MCPYIHPSMCPFITLSPEVLQMDQRYQKDSLQFPKSSKKKHQIINTNYIAIIL